MTDWPYDRDALAFVARRLWQALPAFYRVQDAPPNGEGDLWRLLQVLAAPQAVLRQAIEQLHADLFVDSAGERAVAHLAAMVGMELVFPDLASNRRDVRGAVGWRRRKGTVATLRELGVELTGQVVATQEGWRLVQMTQEINLPRPERVLPALRDPLVAERVSGPLDATHHAVDVRPPRAGGRHHPRHLTHLLHQTAAFPLRGATPVEISLAGHERRWALDPLGAWQRLRARPVPGGEGLATDIVPDRFFATAPGDWFGPDRSVLLRFCGIPAAMPPVPAEAPSRFAASSAAADAALVAGGAAIALLAQDGRRLWGPVRIEVGIAPVLAAGGGLWRPDLAAFVPRGHLVTERGGATATGVSAGPVPANHCVLLRLSPQDGAMGRSFPGATIEVAGQGMAAATASPVGDLARDGFLRGALIVAIPPTRILGAAWYHLAADGALHLAEEEGAPGTVRAAPLAPGGGLALDAEALASPPVGPAWPPAAPEAEPDFLARVPSAPGIGPAMLRGGVAVRRDAAGMVSAAPAGMRSALVFLARIAAPGGATFEPFQALRWTGPGPAGASWEVLRPDGTPEAAGPGARRALYEALARLREDAGGAVSLAVLYASDDAEAVLPPCEVAWCRDDGRSVLVHLPELVAAEGAGPGVALDPALTAASRPVRVAADGSTWAADSGARRRASLGQVAPIAGSATLRRRVVAQRLLCPWRNEDPGAAPPRLLAATAPGQLDLDPAFGLAAVPNAEPPPAFPPGPDGAPPPAVTVELQEGATAHLGARPAPREPLLDLRLPPPTRLVSASGRFSRARPAAWHALPMHRTLTEALSAIAAAWGALGPGDPPPTEVVQFEDSATYANEAPVWPATIPAPLRATHAPSLTIQAAEGERPVVLVAPGPGWALPADPPLHARLALLGIALGGEGWAGMRLPPAAEVALDLVSVLHPENTLVFSDPGPAGGAATSARVRLSETAGLRIEGAGRLELRDSIVDAPGAQALDADAAWLDLLRCTVAGDVLAFRMEASDCILLDRAVVEDRFAGCVRHSRVNGDSVLPRRHALAVDVPVPFVSLDRRAAGWRRLRADCPPAVARGGSEGNEMGAHAILRRAERVAAFETRLAEFTPAGLVTGLIRMD
jgi:hypothetical protein